MNSLLVIFFVLLSNDDSPELNRKVIDFVDKVIGVQVARGECWDLAAAALNHAGAYLDRSTQKSIYIFGKEVNAKKDRIYPGDIIQIENVKIKYEHGNSIITETMSHHTAVIYRVIEPGRYKIAHQNTSFSGRKVGVSELDLEQVMKGKIIFYRPYKID